MQVCEHSKVVVFLLFRRFRRSDCQSDLQIFSAPADINVRLDLQIGGVTSYSNPCLVL